MFGVPRVLLAFLTMNHAKPFHGNWRIAQDSHMKDNDAVVNIGSWSVSVSKNIDTIIPAQSVTTLYPIKTKMDKKGTLRSELVFQSSHLVTDLTGASVKVRVAPSDEEDKERMLAILQVTNENPHIVHVNLQSKSQDRHITLVKDDSTTPLLRGVSPGQFFLSVISIHLMDRTADLVMNIVQLLIQAGFRVIDHIF